MNPFLEAIRQAKAAQQAASTPPSSPPIAVPQPAQPPAPQATPPATAKPAAANHGGKAAPAPQAPVNAPSPATANTPASPESPKPAADTGTEPIRPHNDVRIQQPRLDNASGVTLRFDNAEIFEVVQTIMGDILHLNYVVDPGVTGKVNINGLTPVSSEDLLGVLQSVLAFNNVSIVREGNLYKVMRDAMVPRDAVSGSATGNNGALIQIFAPRYVAPSAILNTLKAFVGPQAAMINDPTDHYLIVVDRAANMKKLADMLQALDVDYLSAIQTEMVQIENGDATEVAKEMETLFKTSQMYNWKGTEANKVFFMPIKRMNAILVAAANKDVLDAAKRRIKDVDVAPKEGLNARINIYTVRNSSAEYLAGIIGQIYGGSGAASSGSNTQRMSSISMSNMNGANATTSQPATKVVEKGPVGSTTATGAGLSGEVQIIPNSKSNSLIIKAGRQDYLQILKLLEQLDMPPKQVLIEANIIEVTLGKENQFGLQWNLAHEHVKFDGRTYSAIAQQQGSPSLPSSTSGQGLLYTIGDLKNVIAQLTAVASDSDINVLSSPRLVASDGKEAKIEIGDDVPIATGSSVTPISGSTTTTTYTYTYRTAGLLLHIKPSINDSGLVDLEINQEVSTISNPSATNPTFSRRSVDTEVSIQEGQTLVIGGLIQNSDSNSNAGIPLLKDIPGLGYLFRNTGKSNKRTELILTITPHIVRGQEDADRFSSDISNAMNELKKFKQRRQNS